MLVLLQIEQSCTESLTSMCNREAVEYPREQIRLASFSHPSSQRVHLACCVAGKDPGDENTTRGFRTTEDVPILRITHFTIQTILFGVWERIPRNSMGAERRKAR